MIHENLRKIARAMFHGMDGRARLWGSEMASHMPSLSLLASVWSMGHAVELGVGQGFSTLSILAGVMMAEKSLVSYDIAMEREVNLWKTLGVSAPPFDIPWRFLVKDSVEAAKDWVDGSVSFLFIDTTHDYEHTKNELAAWLPKMHSQGVIVGHDYFLDRMGTVPCGVKRAVDEFAKANADRVTLQVLPHDQGLFILWPEQNPWHPQPDSYRDEDLTFVMEVYKNLPLARRCLSNLRDHYPRSRVIVWSDGDPDGEIGVAVAEAGGIFRQGERLWLGRTSGPLWERRFKEYLDFPTPYLVKIDTDTAFYRRIRQLPKHDGMFGTIAWSLECPKLIQGGFIGMTRKVVEKILASGMLKSDEMKKFSYVHEGGEVLASEDKALGSLAASLGISLYDHPEISSNWKDRTPNPGRQYAVIHPCKDGSLW